MPLFGNLLQKLRLRQTNDRKDPNGATLDTFEQVPTFSQQDPVMSTTRETAFTYIQTQWVDNSILADTVDSEDMRRSPNGPTRIHDNFNMREIDTDMSTTDESVYYMENGRVKPKDPQLAAAGAVSGGQPHNGKRYNPAFRREAQEDWRLRAARNLKGTGSLRSFSDDHLRDRHLFQSRTQAPQAALGAAWQQTQNEMRALHLENEAVTDAAAHAVRQADMMEGELIALDVKTQKMKARVEELRKRVEKRKAEVAKEVVEKL